MALHRAHLMRHSWTLQTDELPVFRIVHIKEETVTEYSLLFTRRVKILIWTNFSRTVLTEKLEVDEPDAPQRNLQSGAHVDVL